MGLPLADLKLPPLPLQGLHYRGKERLDAIAGLIQAYDEKYNGKDGLPGLAAKVGQDASKSFYVSPDIRFEWGDYGIAAFALKTIKQGDHQNPIMALPHQERVSLSNVNSDELQGILDDVKTQYESKSSTVIVGQFTLDHIYSQGEIALCLVIMHGMVNNGGSHMCENSEHHGSGSFMTLVGQTWPDYDEMVQCCPIWQMSPQVTKLLRGTHTGEILKLYQKGHHFAFEEIVKPVLLQRQAVDMFVSKHRPKRLKTKDNNPMDRLFQAYMHAVYLIRSHAHEGRIDREPEILPLVDLFNGLPDGCDERKKNASHVDYYDQPIPMTVITATRDILPGQEIIFSYGTQTPGGFIARYGFCPTEVLVNPSPTFVDDVFLSIPESLGPPDKWRAQACKLAHFPSTPEELEHHHFQLPEETIDKYTENMMPYSLFLLRKTGPSPLDERQSFADPHLRRLINYLRLCHLESDQDILESNQRGVVGLHGFNFFHLSHLLQLVIDHVLTQVTDLNSSTTAEDLEMANDPTTPFELVTAYHARICQRDALARWRHAFCYRNASPSQHSDPAYNMIIDASGMEDRIFLPNFPRPQAPQCLMDSKGCRYCGRTLK